MLSLLRRSVHLQRDPGHDPAPAGRRNAEAGNTFSQISKEIGVSSATITRVNKYISYGADGYKIVLKRMKEKNAHE